MLQCHTAALETLCMRKDEELASKEAEIIKLRQQMKKSEEAHKRELQELNIRKLQPGEAIVWSLYNILVCPQQPLVI